MLPSLLGPMFIKRFPPQLTIMIFIVFIVFIITIIVIISVMVIIEGSCVGTFFKFKLRWSGHGALKTIIDIINININIMIMIMIIT